VQPEDPFLEELVYFHFESIPIAEDQDRDQSMFELDG
jgi:hypothetical protein